MKCYKAVRQFSISKNVQRFLRAWMYQQGKLIVRFPKLTILFSFIFVLLCGAGVVRMESVTDGIELWSLRSSPSYINYKIIEDRIPSTTTSEYILIAPTAPYNLNSTEIAELVAYADANVTSIVKGDITYDSLCAKNGDVCVARPAVEAYKDGSLSLDEIMALQKSAIINPDQSAIIINFKMKSSPSDPRKEWEMEYLNLLEKFSEDNKNVATINYLASRSNSDETGRLSNADIPLIAVSVVVTFLYMIFTLGRFHFVYNRILLGLTSMFVIFGAVGAAFGITFLLGVPYTPLSLLVIFLVFGIGVDDMIIVVDMYESTDPKLSVEKRVAKSLMLSGSTISLTSFTDFFAFMVSATVEIHAIRYFSIVAAFSVMGLFIFSTTFFIAILYYDGLRIKNCRADVLPCIVYNKEEIESKREKGTNKMEKDGLLKRFMGGYYAKGLMWLPSRIIVLVAFLGFFGFSCYWVFSGNLNVKGLHAKEFLPDGYALDYTLATEEYFGGNNVNCQIMVGPNLDFTDPDVIKKIDDMVTLWTNTGEPHVGPIVYGGNVTDSNGQVLYQRYVTAMKYGTTEEETDDNVLFMKNVQAQVPLPSFIYSRIFIFKERDASLIAITIKNLLITLSVVVVCLVFFIGLRGSVFVTLCLVMIDIDLFCFMSLWGLNLDAVSFIGLSIALGLSVDYCAHVSIAYSEVKGNKRVQRITNALHHIGSSVVAGGFSTFIGVLVLAAAQSGAFRAFFKIFFGIVLFGMLHGLVFLPVVYSFGGQQSQIPEDSNSHQKDKDELENESGSSDEKHGDFKNRPSLKSTAMASEDVLVIQPSAV